MLVMVQSVPRLPVTTRVLGVWKAVSLIIILVEDPSWCPTIIGLTYGTERNWMKTFIHKTTMT